VVNNGAANNQVVNNGAGNHPVVNTATANNPVVNTATANNPVVNTAAMNDRVLIDGAVARQSAEFLDELVRQRLLAIIRGTDPGSAVQAALVLIDSGVRFLEVSLVTTDALRVIAEVAGQVPEGCQIGAGTVLTREDVARAQEAGARFMVTPAVTESVAEAVSRGIPVLAGALTPTEVVTAMGMGATAVKLFPSATGGPAYLRALRDPLPRVPFVPVGGVDAALAAEYFAAGAVAVGIGSPLVGDAVRGGDLDALRARAAKFLAVAKASRAPR
jgi:2-dehydro-3-deoxyphosphogluconate aldolase/(4S)-4-hydroxy-2-oxoglutarate aldolase